MNRTIAERCHGRVILGGVTAAISSDNFDRTTKPAPGSLLAGPDPIPAGMIAGADGVVGTSDDVVNPWAGEPGGKHVSWGDDGWNFSAGRTVGPHGVGGLSTNYNLEQRRSEPHQLVGYANCVEEGQGCIFTATQIKGVGSCETFKDDVVESGVPLLSPSVDTHAVKLFILDSGKGSLDLIHIDPSGNLQADFLGRKDQAGFPYWVNNYIGFDPELPRP